SIETIETVRASEISLEVAESGSGGAVRRRSQGGRVEFDDGRGRAGDATTNPPALAARLARDEPGFAEPPPGHPSRHQAPSGMVRQVRRDRVGGVRQEPDELVAYIADTRATGLVVAPAPSVRVQCASQCEESVTRASIRPRRSTSPTA